jgi:hypothetical protein
MKKTTISSLTISEVRREHAWWRYFWPLQSRRALAQTLVVLTVLLSAMGWTVVHLLDPAGLAPVLFCATTAYFLCGVYPLLPARLNLATRGEARHFVADVQARLIKIGYVVSDQPQVPGRFHYCSKLPRWLCWDEQEVELLVSEHELVLHGPITVLRLLRARLLPPEDYAYLKAKG